MKKIKIGSVGLGRLGKQHAENIKFRIPNAELLAVCSVKEEEVNEVQKAWGIEYIYIDFDEMLKNKELDAIFIASSSNVHCEQIEKALEAGFDVFSEKPLGVTVEEVEKVEKIIAKHSDKIFMLGFMRRYDASYAHAKELIDNGKIGKPFMVRSYGLDPDSSARSVIPFLKTSGGLFLDMAAHDIDIARWFLGKEAKSVYAAGGCYKYPEYEKEDDIDNGVALVKFEEDMTCFIYVGRTCPHGYQVETEIIGTEGSLRIANVPEKNLVTIYDENGAVRECSQNFPERFREAFVNELQEFVNCVIERRKPGVGAFDGVQATKIAYACKEAQVSGQIVSIN
ncbi:MAG: inositol 2-dehydrogenase [bacterium]|nr:inositol 2-dehydrogenase [bacterium]